MARPAKRPCGPALCVRPAALLLARVALLPSFAAPCGTNAQGRQDAPFIPSQALTILSKAAGVPVRVWWTREDEIRNGYHHAASAHCLKGTLDGDNKVGALRYCGVRPSIMGLWNPAQKTGFGMEYGMGLVDMAIDCGRCVNPEGIRKRLVGAVVHGHAVATQGKITTTGGVVDQHNFDDYPVGRMNNAPLDVRVHVLDDHVDLRHLAASASPGYRRTHRALLDALAVASGQRVRELPIGDRLRGWGVRQLGLSGRSPPRRLPSPCAPRPDGSRPSCRDAPRSPGTVRVVRGRSWIRCRASYRLPGGSGERPARVPASMPGVTGSRPFRSSDHPMISSRYPPGRRSRSSRC